MKYWVYHEGEVPGAYEPDELAGLPGFTPASLVCPADASSEERRWQRAGLYPDIIEALRRHDLQPPPVAPPPAGGYVDPAAATGPEDLLNATSHKIFLHVTELMKELENRREERALTQSLQRSLVELKSELQAARERVRFLDDRVSTIPALEERERRAQEEAERLRVEIRQFEERLREKDARIGQLEQRLHEAALALDNALRGQTDALREQKRMAQVVEELNRQLATKESTLAKSLAMIRRLESELGHLLPIPASPAPKSGGPISPPPAEGGRSAPPPPPPLAAAAGEPPVRSRPEAFLAPLPDIPKLSPGPVVEAKPAAAPVEERLPEIIPLSKSEEPVSAAPTRGAEAPTRGSAAQLPPVPAAAPELRPEERAPAATPAPIPSEEKPAVQPTRDEPKLPLAPQTPVKPIPAPWQSALDEVTSFLKRNLPGRPPDEKREK